MIQFMPANHSITNVLSPNLIKLDNAKRGIPSQGGKIDLDLWHSDPKSIGFLPSSLTTYMWSLKVIELICSLYCAHKAIYTECKNWPWPLTPWSKINWVPPLLIINLHVKFEKDSTQTVICILSTRSYTQSAKVDLDLWPCDQNSIGFFLSSSTTYRWSLKVIELKLLSVSCPQALFHRVQKLTLTFDPVIPNQLGSSSHHPQLTCEVWKWSDKNCSLYRVHKEGATDARTDSPTHSLTQPPTNGRVTISPPTLLRGDNKRPNLSMIQSTFK